MQRKTISVGGLRALVLGLALVLSTNTVSSAAYVGDALVQRVEASVACLSSVHANLPDAMIAFETDRSRPLSLLLLSENAHEELSLSRDIVARTYFGDSSSSAPIATVDLAGLSHHSTSEIQREIHSKLVSVVRASPKRSMLVVENLQALPSTKLTALDIFLDALQGKRAPFQAARGDTIDTTGTVFLFLFTTSAPIKGSPWRVYMEAAWAFDGVEFTTSALIGRISEGLEVTSALQAKESCATLLHTSVASPTYTVPMQWAVAMLALGGVCFAAASYRAKGASHEVAEPLVNTLPQPKRTDEAASSTESGVVENTPVAVDSCPPVVLAEPVSELLTGDETAASTPPPTTVKSPSTKKAGKKKAKASPKPTRQSERLKDKAKKE
ncbi:hypothetical protein SDRG_10709 [Saprolegnia diclina VS20]|uniref:Transmembrane protein n=1 Tax=Saprolegnia diclina (strain VS20) TaxID=1156394 RepID=T0QDA6_SAPDV|nr:hypothetical protein SDRG_10709 [Saprolegnia diclina VS20]EQC31535.1 hypothetical protein SDRG_10709 [Saprolegnia diclina VS20]|eukprot:XP_008614934.1 hypothetical protein SDRG_10709 [Saprolegnia diclina VS20]